MRPESPDEKAQHVTLCHGFSELSFGRTRVSPEIIRENAFHNYPWLSLLDKRAAGVVGTGSGKLKDGRLKIGRDLQDLPRRSQNIGNTFGSEHR